LLVLRNLILYIVKILSKSWLNKRYTNCRYSHNVRTVLYILQLLLPDAINEYQL